MSGENTQTTEPSFENSFRAYAWDYFALHADQRLKAFHFYILLSTAIIGGFAVLLKNGDAYKWMAVFGALLTFFSFVFWKLDRRTHDLLGYGKAALEYLDAQHNLPNDNDGLPHVLRLISREQAVSKQIAAREAISDKLAFTYTRCFSWVFITFSLVGVVTVLACMAYGHY
ncbi:hypothetical protein GPJ81_15330 [Pseudomonas alkylphenolica]|jgi:hypothetical protein|uniref:Uncharacterized protein n=1 Tax=Pseudomonas alkylphenolica TaxID=237609 RepID=A0A6I6GTX7_9PSED|nr:hypothetical protein [Pseudomonas alkylphenolica]QGW78002.1 hypothetical protein GPJ81_15330 [Pseudomonas alkylphenolica]